MAWKVNYYENNISNKSLTNNPEQYIYGTQVQAILVMISMANVEKNRLEEGLNWEIISHLGKYVNPEDPSEYFILEKI